MTAPRRLLAAFATLFFTGCTHGVEIAPATASAHGPAAGLPRLALSEEEREWAASVLEHNSSRWSHAWEGDRLLFLFDPAVPCEFVAGSADRVRRLLNEEVSRRFPCPSARRRVILFRVCKDKSQYHEYGGTAGSWGTWCADNREAVVYHDANDPARSASTLQGLAVLAYFEDAGLGKAHSWFLHGLADSYAAADVPERGPIRPGVDGPRREALREAASSGTMWPLPRLMKFSHQEFYGPRIGANFAQAWSVVRFLATTDDPRWRDSLSRYFTTFREVLARGRTDRMRGKEGDDPRPGEQEIGEARGQALEAAFGAFDETRLHALETAWRASLDEVLIDEKTPDTRMTPPRR